MAEQFVRVYLAPGDEEQLAELDDTEYVEFAGTVNGAEVAVRFYRAPHLEGEPAVTGRGIGDIRTVGSKLNYEQPSWTVAPRADAGTE